MLFGPCMYMYYILQCHSSQETRCEERHSSTCMDQTVQGGLAGSDRQACIVTNHSKRQTIEALHIDIHLQQETSNLDCEVRYGTPPLTPPPPKKTSTYYMHDYSYTNTSISITIITFYNNHYNTADTHKVQLYDIQLLIKQSYT